VDAVRRRVQNETLGHRGRSHDPLYRIRRVLLRGAENLNAASYARLLAGLDAGDPHGHVTATYIAAQELRHVYAAPDLHRAKQRLQRFYWACARPGVPELERLARTIEAWQEQLLAYFTTDRASNGPTEAVNLLIKRIKRVSDSATSTITGSGCSSTAASPGTLPEQHGYEAAHHASCRRAELWDGRRWPYGCDLVGPGRSRGVGTLENRSEACALGAVYRTSRAIEVDRDGSSELPQAQVAPDNLLHDLGGPAVDARDAGIGPRLRDRILGHVAVTTVQLHP